MENQIEEFYDYLLDKKCKDIAVYDLTNDEENPAIVFVATISNTVNNKKFASNVMADMKLEYNPEGFNKGEWIIFDFGQCILHSFIPAAREKYNLDKLWKSKRIQIGQAKK